MAEDQTAATASESSHQRAQQANTQGLNLATTTSSQRNNASVAANQLPRTWMTRWREKDKTEQEPPALGLTLLHASSEPRVDLIFVHGLKGHAIKTWRKSGEPQSFWPQLWLPLEKDFQHVNIHTFGYEANFSKGKSFSLLSVDDFGRSLFEQMRNSPNLVKDDKSPIIMLGHSLGGLVIKKAFVLAKDARDFHDRIRTIFFLGTPHRGSEYAKTLGKILSVSGSTYQHYIKDLTTDSVTARLLNVEFIKHAHDLPIYSFYEIMKMSLGPRSDIVVERDSAVLGEEFKNEHVQYLSADHKAMCKFSDPSDGNYTRLRDALAGATQNLLKEVSINKQKTSQHQLLVLEAYLAVEMLDEHEHYQVVKGSCEWISDCAEFREWRTIHPRSSPTTSTEYQKYSPSLLWLHANPGTGKTALATHIIKQLHESKVECAHHYFHMNDESSQSLAHALGSIAFQMAISNEAIRGKILSLFEAGSSLSLDDARSIWTNVFVRGIFQTPGITSQYWVIDALDECARYQEFFTLLRHQRPLFSLQVFITSRTVSDMPHLCHSLHDTITLRVLRVPETASLSDIERYIQTRIEGVPAASPENRSQLAKEILDRSNASFLWVRLVLDELQQVFSNNGVLQVLTKIPNRMVPYYQHTLVGLAELGEKAISKAVLRWIIGSTRKLTATELSSALKLDLDIDLPGTRSAIEGVCGQLVSVHDQSLVVDTIHPTVREFLLSEGAGEFQVEQATAHERISRVCLKALMSSDLQPIRGHTGAEQRRANTSPFLDYAICQVFEHVNGALSSDDALLMDIDHFLRTKILIWIEHLTRKGGFYILLRASKHLMAYLERHSELQVQRKQEMEHLGEWSTDLSRVLTKFDGALRQNASAIHLLIPPLCPLESAIHRNFGSAPGSLKVVGFRRRAWDDCIAEMAMHSTLAYNAVSRDDNLIAVGMDMNLVSLYNNESFRQIGSMRTTWPIDRVQLTDDGLVVSTIKSIALHDLQGNQVWEKKLRARCILLVVFEDRIYGVVEHGAVLVWALSSGELLSQDSFPYRNHEAPTEHNQLRHRAPSMASISPDMELMALGYRGGTVCLWDLKNKEVVAWALDEIDRQPAVLLFNPNPNIRLLFVGYTDHTMSLYETTWGQLVHSYTPPIITGIKAAACSTNGNTLATANTIGHLQIWDFKTLKLIYHIEAGHSVNRSLIFTTKGDGIVDLFSHTMRIWSPVVLARGRTEDDQGVNNKAAIMSTSDHRDSEEFTITSLCAHPTLPLLFAGHGSGTVAAYSSDTGKKQAMLYTHPLKDWVFHLSIGKNNTIASADVSGLMISKLDLRDISSPVRSSVLREERLSNVIQQICHSDSGEYLIVSTRNTDHLYATIDGSLKDTQTSKDKDRTRWKWLPTPPQMKDSHFIQVSNQQLTLYCVDGVLNPIMSSTLELQGEAQPFEAVAGAIHPNGYTLVLETRSETQHRPSSTVSLFDLKRCIEGGVLRASCTLASSVAQRFLSISSRTKSINFIHRNSWLSSISLDDANRVELNGYSQHFFIPKEYLVERHGLEVQPVTTKSDDVVFCLSDELVIVKNGLRFVDQREFDVEKRY